MTLEIALFVALFCGYSWALVRLGRTMGERHADTMLRGAQQDVAEAHKKGVEVGHKYKAEALALLDAEYQRGVGNGRWMERAERKEAASAAATKGWQKRRASDAGINEEARNG